MARTTAAATASGSPAKGGAGSPAVIAVRTKRGFGRTAITAGLPVPPSAGEPAAVPADVIAAMDARRHVVYAPSVWWWIMLVIRALPRAVLRRVRF